MGKVLWLSFRVSVFIPVKLIFKTLGICICVSTCGYCCGFCRPKRGKKVAELKDKAAKADSSKQVNPATVAEVEALLQTAKKEKTNLQEAAKKLAELVKSGKEFQKPKNLKGKTLTKDVV